LRSIEDPGLGADVDEARSGRGRRPHSPVRPRAARRSGLARAG
jgi:hypothetical protein